MANVKLQIYKAPEDRFDFKVLCFSLGSKLVSKLLLFESITGPKFWIPIRFGGGEGRIIHLGTAQSNNRGAKGAFGHH